MQEPRVLDRRGADDDEGHAVVEVPLDGLEVADPASQLDRDVGIHRGDDRLHRRLVARLAGHRAVQVDDVDALRAQGGPLRRGLAGIVGEHRRGVHAALLEAHAVAVFQVDRGNDLHGADR
jgi:hypothetical protein